MSILELNSYLRIFTHSNVVIVLFIFICQSTQGNYNFDPDSNVTEKSDLSIEKHPSLRTSIDTGRMILINPVLPTTRASIRDNFDSDSTITEEDDPSS
jgi:hypothetical protein